MENKENIEVTSYGKSSKRPIIKATLILGVGTSLILGGLNYIDNNSESNIMSNTPENTFKVLNLDEPEKLSLNLDEPRKLNLYLPEQELRTLFLPDENSTIIRNKNNEIKMFSDGMKLITKEDMLKLENQEKIENIISEDFGLKG